jgi:hypothetical protein
MAKKKPVRKKTASSGARKAASRKSAAKTTARAAKTRARTIRKVTRAAVRPAKRTRPAARSAAIADVRGAEVRRDLGGVRLEAGRAGDGRVKRMIYPPGYKWSVDTKPFVDTDYCMHAHVGFLVQGRIDVIYADGCVEVFEAPQVVAVAPGHDGHVVGREPAVLIEFDFESDTITRFGMPDAHRHE